MSQVFGHYNALAKDEKHGCFIRCLRVGQQSPNESRSLISWSPEDKAIFALTAMAPKPVSFGDWPPPNETATRSAQASWFEAQLRSIARRYTTHSPRHIDSGSSGYIPAWECESPAAPAGANAPIGGSRNSERDHPFHFLGGSTRPGTSAAAGWPRRSGFHRRNSMIGSFGGGRLTSSASPSYLPVGPTE